MFLEKTGHLDPQLPEALFSDPAAAREVARKVMHTPDLEAGGRRNLQKTTRHHLLTGKTSLSFGQKEESSKKPWVFYGFVHVSFYPSFCLGYTHYFGPTTT